MQSSSPALDAGRLDGIPPEVAAYIESVQPYHWEDEGFRYHVLWLVHDLDRIDKHRRLTLTTSWLGLQYVTVPEVATDTVQTEFSHPGSAPIKDKDVLVSYMGAEEGVNAHFARAVSINEGTAAGYALGDLLTTVHGRVTHEVTVLTQGQWRDWPPRS